MINVSSDSGLENQRAAYRGREGRQWPACLRAGRRLLGISVRLMIEEGGGDADQIFESNGVRLYVDPVSISYLKGAEVDFVETVTGGGFTIKNPNATSTCGCGQSFNV